MNQKKVWNKIAPKWNKYRTRISPKIESFLKEQTGRVLDVGCGSGRNFIKKKNLDIYGIDFSEEMIKFAKEKNIAKELRIMKHEKIPYVEDFFDSSICIAVLHCIKSKRKREKLLKEIYRTLKPNSEFLITVWSKNHPKLKKKKKFAKISWRINDKKWLRHTYIYEKEELENILKETGFKILNSFEEENIVIKVKK